MNRFSASASKRQLPVIFIVICIIYALSSAHQSSAQQPASLITRPVNESQLTVLKGNTHHLARPEFDLGTAAANLPMQRMLLVLKRSAAQESALRQLLDNQQDKSSPS